jgi:chemotaxis protein CheY-P-specific phosphatase CheC
MNPTEHDLGALLLLSAADVLEAMYFTSVLGPSDTPLTGAGWVARLEFEGELSGSFTLRMNTETARLLALNFFGEEESEISDTAVGDMVGEMANMICGSVLSRLEAETHFKLSHPSVEATSEAMEEAVRGVPQLLETDSGVLGLCLETP